MIPNALYIHIPFCARKCRYCDFNSIVSESDTINRYMDALESELRALGDRYVFETVYIGGGTPSILSEAQFEKMLHAVTRRVSSYGIQEFTVEANPGTLTRHKIGLLKEYMVNRISLGVQSFQERHLSFLGRIHSGNDARDAFTSLREAGFGNINIDLIFGHPGQSPDDWERDLQAALELNPEHISTYALTYEEGTSLTGDLENGVIQELDEYTALEMYKTSIRCLAQNGYHHYEISNFAKQGRECVHNLVYWKNLGYAGVGAGAFSFIDGVRTSNEKDIDKYIDGINKHTRTKPFWENLALNQYASETVVMSLRLRRGISNTDFYERFGYNIEDQFREQIHGLSKDGLVSYEDERLKLTEKGLFIADTVMAEFV